MLTKEEFIKFNKQFGDVDFIKLAVSAINEILVNKGIVTVDELNNVLQKNIMEALERYGDDD